MAQKEYIENWRGQIEYIEICRDDYSCRRRFKNHEEDTEAELYFSYLQSLDNQIKISAQLEHQNELTKENHSNSYSTPSSTQFPRRPPVSTQKLDPEYAEWLQFKKETDPKFIQWKKEKEAQIAKQNEEKAKRDAEQKKIIEEKEKLEREYSQTSTISKYKKAFIKYKQVIYTYEKWSQIIRKLSEYGDSPLREIDSCIGINGSKFFYWAKQFIDPENQRSIQTMKNEYIYMQNGLKQSFVSIESEYSFWESHFNLFKNQHKRLQYLIGKSAKLDYEEFAEYGEGISAYVRVLIQNLSTAKEYKSYGLFGLEGELRKKHKIYWQKYSSMYSILEPHINDWEHDMWLMFADVEHYILKFRK